MNGIPSRSLGLPTRIALGHNILAAAHSINRWVCCYFYLKAPACLIFYSHRLLFQVPQDRGSFSHRSYSLAQSSKLQRSFLASALPSAITQHIIKPINPARLPAQPFPSLPANASGSRRIIIPRDRKNLLRALFLYIRISDRPAPKPYPLCSPLLPAFTNALTIIYPKAALAHFAFVMAYYDKQRTRFRAVTLPFPCHHPIHHLKPINPARLPTHPFPSLPANASGSRRITIPRNRKNLLRACSATQSPVPALPKIHSHRLLFQVPQDRGSFSTNPTRSHNLPSFNAHSWLQHFPALPRNTSLKPINPRAHQPNASGGLHA